MEQQPESQVNKDAAIDFIYLLEQGEESAWCALAESSIFAPTALVELIEISELGAMESEEPTEQELGLFATGAMPPGRRAVEIAFHIVYTPEYRQQFDLFAKPIHESLAHLTAKNHTRILQILTAKKSGKGQQNYS